MKLGLGTVEFAAKSGKHALRVTLDEAGRILSLAEGAGIDLLDSAAHAGNSEQVLGECLPPDAPFKLVCRAPQFHLPAISALHADQLELALQTTLENLNRGRIYCLMTGFHDGLSAEHGERLFSRMTLLKERGLIEKTGISVSGGADIGRVLSDFKPDIVQIPLNVLDQRLLLDGSLARLKQAGIEIHVRDVFLQGVLLDPTHLHPWFWPIRKLMDSYHEFLIAEGLTPLEGALAFIAALPEVDYALVGVHSAEQLEEILHAATSGPPASAFAPFACVDTRFTDPLRWNLYE